MTVGETLQDMDNRIYRLRDRIERLESLVSFLYWSGAVACLCFLATGYILSEIVK